MGIGELQEQWSSGLCGLELAEANFAIGLQDWMDSLPEVWIT